MRYAIVSDLHANIEALNAVLASIDALGIDQLICLGDIVGYNASPNECIELVRDRGMRTIAGNHDRAAIGRKDTSRFGADARHAIAWTQRVLTPQSLAFLEQLPGTMSIDQRFFVVHGALHPEPNDDVHLSNWVRVERSFRELCSDRFGSNICFFGHTHHPLAFELDAGAIHRIAPERVDLASNKYYLINPGSVGQSRDGDQRAAYAIYDTEKPAVEWQRVAYDVASTLKRNRAAGLSAEPFVRRSLSRIRAMLAGV